MSLLRSEKDNFDVEVFYVFMEDGEISIIDKVIDIDVINKSEEEKNKLEENDKIGILTNIPFNKVINLEKYSPTDVRKATFSFRRPSFDDMPLLLSSFVSIDSSGNVAPGDAFEFHNRKLKLLFVKGIAQDQDGKEIKINSVNLGKIPPVLGQAMSLGMSDFVDI